VLKGTSHMEIIVWIIGIVLILGFIGWLIEVVNDWKNSIDWAKFLGTLIVGGIALAVIFSFTAEGVLVIVGAYIVLIIGALTFGAFKKSDF
jgi:DMSO reductase anchor subunit